eukprot:TRINITY_DN2541_c0_g1_i7.p1 TRINITY_DN2541_c0_g1~~TRINITY_DN2541_c0_g1_i7.p1  ORF type:complete len:104 (+),score=2.60 TRINITY_DN2541_c0_g1_i7:197-508(+)
MHSGNIPSITVNSHFFGCQVDRLGPTVPCNLLRTNRELSSTHYRAYSSRFNGTRCDDHEHSSMFGGWKLSYRHLSILRRPTTCIIILYIISACPPFFTGATKK